MLANIGKHFGKEAVKKGLYNINKANIHIPASNNLLYGYKKNTYYPENSIYNKDKFNYLNKLGKLKENEPFPSHISLGLLKSVNVLPEAEYRIYSQKIFGYEKSPTEIKDKISQKKYQELQDIDNKRALINQIYLFPYTGFHNYKLKLTPEQVIKEYNFYKNTTDFRMRVIKQKMVELGLASEKEIKNFESNVKLSESQIDEYYKFMEILDNKDLVNKITIEELKNAFKNTIIYIKTQFNIPNNLLSNLKNNFNEAIKITGLTMTYAFILSLVKISKLIKNAKLLKEYLKSLNNYFYNIIIDNSVKLKNKIIENFKRIVEFFKNINKKGVETKYSTEFYELLQTPSVNKQDLNTKIMNLIELIDKNNVKVFKNKAKRFMIYISKYYKLVSKQASLLFKKNNTLFDKLLMKLFEKIANMKLKNDSFMTLDAINTMHKLLKF